MRAGAQGRPLRGPPAEPSIHRPLPGFDQDKSGNINFKEAYTALSSFGYRLSEPIMQLMFYSYDSDRTGALGFDEFVQMNAELSSMTNMFRRYECVLPAHRCPAHAGKTPAFNAPSTAPRALVSPPLTTSSSCLLSSRSRRVMSESSDSLATNPPTRRAELGLVHTSPPAPLHPHSSQNLSDGK